MRIQKQKKELPYDVAFDMLDDVMTPYEIERLKGKGKIALEDIDKIKYNQQPKKKQKPKKI
jgi:hypothetical protein